MSHMQGANCHEVILFPERLDDYIAEDHPIRFLDALVDELDLAASGFQRAVPATTGRDGGRAAQKLTHGRAGGQLICPAVIMSRRRG
jgi:hypothetical protein